MIAPRRIVRQEGSNSSDDIACGPWPRAASPSKSTPRIPAMLLARTLSINDLVDTGRVEIWGTAGLHLFTHGRFRTGEVIRTRLRSLRRDCEGTLRYLPGCTVTELPLHRVQILVVRGAARELRAQCVHDIGWRLGLGDD